MAEQQSPQPQGGCKPNKHTLHPLLWTASCGDLEEFRSLLLKEDRDQLKLQKDQFGNTALHLASRFGKEVIVKEILKGYPTKPPPPGDDDLLRATNDNGDTAAHQAIRNHYVKIALSLIKKQPGVAEVVSNKSESLLYLAAERGHKDIVKYLLRNLRESKDGGPNGRTVLHAAVWPWTVSRAQPALSIMLMLLRKRPTLISTADGHGDIPLHYAAYMGNEILAFSLLSADDNLSTVYHANNDGNTPIHMAAMAGHLPVIGLLLHACPDGGAIVNKSGCNALHLAIQCERTNVVRYILGDPRLQGQVHVRDDDGNGPLHLAALHWNLQILRLLLRSGVDKLATNDKGQTALDVFLENEVENPTIQWFEALLRLREVIVAIPKKEDTEAKREVIVAIPKKEDTEEAQRGKEVLMGHLALNEKVKTVIQSRRQDRTDIMKLTTFIGAITFAAAFAVPGGYSDGGVSPGAHPPAADPPAGEPNLQGKVAFKIFIASDVITIVSSLAALFLSLNVIHDRINIYSLLQYWSATQWLLTCSFVGMTTAFAAGMYAILAPEIPWFGVLLCVICGSLPFTTFVWSKFEDLMLELRKWAIQVSWSFMRKKPPQPVCKDLPF